MAVTDNLGAPSLDKHVYGRFTLFRYFVDAEASVSAPVAPVNLTSVQEVAPDAVSWDIEDEIFQAGGGGDSVKYQSIPRHNITIRMLAGDVGDFLAAVLGQTWAGGGQVGIPLVFKDLPLFNLEAIARRVDNNTHILSVVYQDLIPLNNTLSFSLDGNIIDLPFYSKHVPILLKASYECVLDKFNCDGSTTDFTLSDTPVDIVDTTDAIRLTDDFILDNMIYVKEQTSSDTVGTRLSSGVSVSGTTLTVSPAPASGSKLSAFYVKQTT